MITSFNWAVWVSIETKHGCHLEFILNAAEERNKKTHAFYTDRLQDMIKDKVGPVIRENCTYGNVSLCIEAETPEELQKAIEGIDAVAAEWVRIYRINKMQGFHS